MTDHDGPRRIFLDVGGHLGETLNEALDPEWAFDEIWVFEPAASCWPAIRDAIGADDRARLVEAGWWNADTEMTLFDPGLIGASVHEGKSRTAASEPARFIDAATWIEEHVDQAADVWLKLNCEGSECVVLDRLLDTDAIGRVDHLLVHFDVEKIPGLAADADRVRTRLDQSGTEYLEARQIMFGRSHRAKTANWLNWTRSQGAQRWRYTVVARIGFRLRQRLYPVKQWWLRRQPR